MFFSLHVIPVVREPEEHAQNGAIFGGESEVYEDCRRGVDRDENVGDLQVQ